MPPPDAPLRVAGPPPLADATLRWLAARRRRAAAAPPPWPRPTTPARRYRLWRPNPFVESIAAELTPGSAFEPGCGSGRDAVHLASLGWRVVAIDRLPDALARAADLERRYLPDASAIAWTRADLRHLVLPADSAAYELTLAVRCVNRAVLRQMPAACRSGGSLVLEAFTPVQRATHGRPAREADVIGAEELRELWGALEWLVCEEAWRGDVHTLRAWARRR